MQWVWTLVYYTWKKNWRLFMGHNSAEFHWRFHFPFPLKKVDYEPNYFILWTIADCEAWWFDIFDSSMLTDGCFSSCCGKGTKKISLSAIRCSTTEPQRLYNERNPLRSSYMTRFHAWHQTKNIFLCFFTVLKTLLSLLFYLQTWRYWHPWS